MRDLTTKEEYYYNVLGRYLNRIAHTKEEAEDMIETLDFLVEAILEHELNLNKELEARLDELRRCVYRLGQNKTSSES